MDPALPQRFYDGYPVPFQAMPKELQTFAGTLNAVEVLQRAAERRALQHANTYRGPLSSLSPAAFESYLAEQGGAEAFLKKLNAEGFSYRSEPRLLEQLALRIQLGETLSDGRRNPDYFPSIVRAALPFLGEGARRPLVPEPTLPAKDGAGNPVVPVVSSAVNAVVDAVQQLDQLFAANPPDP